jgi:hypothetical protein
MDPNLAINLLLVGLTRMADFGRAINAARLEGRELTPAEVAAAGFTAQDALNALDAKVKAKEAGEQPS